MRADRLVAVLLLLQARGRVTAAAVAADLEVSVATARRDLEALSTAGVPVYPQPGRGGGWSLVGGARTDLTGLTAAEARALFLLVGPGTNGGEEARSALRKLVRALPETFRADAEAAATAVLVDPAGWGERPRHRPPLVALLQDAVVARRRVRLAYANRAGVPSDRLVDPWGVVGKDDTWYLVAGTEAGRRTFRVDRIAAAEMTDETATRPDGFDLDAAWEEIVERTERRRGAITATLRVPARLLPVLRDQWGRQFEVVETPDQDPATVRVSAFMARTVAEQLAGWGTTIEVVEPPEVRAELARIGAELAAAYAPPPAS